MIAKYRSIDFGARNYMLGRRLPAADQRLGCAIDRWNSFLASQGSLNHHFTFSNLSFLRNGAEFKSFALYLAKAFHASLPRTP